MKEVFEALTKIQTELGGNCEVSARINDLGGLTIRIYWRDGSIFGLELVLHPEEPCVRESSFATVDFVIAEAKRRREEHESNP